MEKYSVSIKLPVFTFEFLLISLSPEICCVNVCFLVCVISCQVLLETGKNISAQSSWPGSHQSFAKRWRVRASLCRGVWTEPQPEERRRGRKSHVQYIFVRVGNWC